MRGLVAASLGLLCACTPPPDPCADLHAHQALSATMLFGAIRPGGGPVTADEWRTFLRDTVTPRFPDGLTALEGSGQWRDPASGTIGGEPSRILLIAAPATPATSQALSEIAEAYKERFLQKSVGILVAPTCAAF